MEYKVVSNDELELLVEQVNEFLKDGWKPNGALVVITYEYKNERKGYSEHGFGYYQSIVKESE